MDPTIEVPGTGSTVGELQGYGYSDADIQAFFSAGDTPTSGISSSPIGPSFDGGSTGGNTSWVSGLSGILSTVGTTFTNINRALNPPKAGTTLYNPQTGLPYGIDPRTGKPVAAAQRSTLVNVLVIGMIVVGGLWVLRHL